MDRSPSELVDVIRRVRNRWRMKLALRGAVVVVAGTLLALLLSASGLEAFRFSPAAIIAFRIIAVAVFAGLLCSARLAAAPPRHRRAGRAVPRGIDPSLEAAHPQRRRSSAHAEAGGDHGTRRAWSSSWSSRPSSSAARSRTARVVERAGAAPSAVTLGGDRRGRRARSSCSARVPPPRPVGAARSSRAAPKRPARTRSTSRPGNTKVPRGADQTVSAKLVGFTSNDVERDDAQRRRRRRSSACRSSPAREPGTFEGMLFHLEKPTEYYVESNGVRSPTISRWTSSICRRSIAARCSSTASPPTPGSRRATIEPAATSRRSAGTEVQLHDRRRRWRRRADGFC